MDLENRVDRNVVRNVVHKARQDDLITQSEAGFIVTLVEKFRADIERKTKIATQLQGEINQLRANEKIIINMVEGIISAAERDKARQETFNKIRGIKDGQEESAKKNWPVDHVDPVDTDNK